MQTVCQVPVCMTSAQERFCQASDRGLMSKSCDDVRVTSSTSMGCEEERWVLMSRHYLQLLVEHVLTQAMASDACTVSKAPPTIKEASSFAHRLKEEDSPIPSLSHIPSPVSCCSVSARRYESPVEDSELVDHTSIITTEACEVVVPTTTANKSHARFPDRQRQAETSIRKETSKREQFVCHQGVRRGRVSALSRPPTLTKRALQAFHAADSQVMALAAASVSRQRSSRADWVSHKRCLMSHSTPLTMTSASATSRDRIRRVLAPICMDDLDDDSSAHHLPTSLPANVTSLSSYTTCQHDTSNGMSMNRCTASDPFCPKTASSRFRTERALVTEECDKVSCVQQSHGWVMVSKELMQTVVDSVVDHVFDCGETPAKSLVGGDSPSSINSLKWKCNMLRRAMEEGVSQ